MPTKMYIFGEAGLISTRRPKADLGDLEHDLNDFLQNRGEIIWDRDEHTGYAWNVDVLLHADADDIDGWIGQLTGFLRQWGVQDRTISLTIIREGATSAWEHRRVEL